MNRIRVTSRDRRPTLRVGIRTDAAPPPDSESRATNATGFTLVELLVVIVVMLILIVMTVTAIDFAFTSERVKAGARQVQSALGGARDRAIFAKEARGLRLLPDQDDPRLATSMVYIGAPSNWSEGQIRLERIDANNDGVADIVDTNGDGVPDGTSIAIVRGDALCGWYTLMQRGFLGLYEDLNFNFQLDPGEDVNGNNILDLDAPRIKIPADDNGVWYTVIANLTGPYKLTASNQVLQLTTPYQQVNGASPSDNVIAFQGTGPNTYILELPPRVLAEAQPILLPEGVCIDLDGSVVPPLWRPGFGAGLTTPYSSRMEILFSPRGTVTGPLAAMGLLHLYVAERKDVQKLTDIGVLNSGGTQVPRLPVNSNNASAVVPSMIVPGISQFGPDDLIGQRTSVTLFTQTGKVSSHAINAIDTDGDGYADNPFLYSTQGEGTNQ